MSEVILEALEGLAEEYPHVKLTTKRITRFVDHLSRREESSVIQAIDHWIDTDTSGFFPSIGQLNALVSQFEVNDLYADASSPSPIDHPDWPELTVQRQLLFDRLYNGEEVAQEAAALSKEFERIDATLSAGHIVRKYEVINAIG